MWSTILRLLVKVALYAADHPDQVVAVVHEVKAARATPDTKE